MADQDPIVAEILRETDPGEREHKTRVRRFDRAYDVYRATPPKTTSRGPDNWQARVRVPLAMQVLDTALVNMHTGNRPRCRVTARSPAYHNQEAAFGHVMDYHTDRAHLVEKDPLIIQSGLIYGLAVGKNHWRYEEGHKAVGATQTDGSYMASRMPTVLYNGPDFEPWDIYDAWWDPNGRDVDTCQYVVLRFWPTKDELRALACTHPKTHDPHECDGIYHNVEDLIAAGPGSKQSYTAQERFLGGQQNLRKDRYECWEVWRSNRVQVVGNRQILLRDDPNPHWHGKKPIVMASTRPDLHKIQGIPETELIDHIQQAFWTNHNLRIENEHLTVWRGFTYREGGVVDPDSIEIKPRAKIGVTDHDDLRPIEVQPLPPEAYREEESLLSLAQLVTGINSFISGGPQAGVDQNTATGVSVLSEVSSRLLKFKAGRIRWNVWQRTYEQWGSDIQQYMTEPLWIKIVGPGSEASWKQFSPDEVAGEFDFQLDGTDDSLSKQQDRSDSIALLNAFAPFAQLGIVNMPVLIERVGRAFGIEDPSSLVASPQQAPPAAPMPPGAPQNGQPPMPTQPEQVVPGQNQQTQLNPVQMQGQFNQS